LGDEPRPRENAMRGAESCWLWLAGIVSLSLVYRILYARTVSAANIPQISAILYSIAGHFLSERMRERESDSKQDRVLLLYSLPLLIGSVIYCTVRFGNGCP
jgi:hypothetical protein